MFLSLPQTNSQTSAAGTLGTFSSDPDIEASSMEALGLRQAGSIGKFFFKQSHMAVCQNLVPLVNPKIAAKWMFIPLDLIIIGFDPPPYDHK